MDIGVGLPSTIPGVQGADVLEAARRAERLGLSSLGVIDRMVYPNLEPLMALAAAAAVTERIRLMTAILIAPYRLNTALLAKQAASLDVLSNGRFVLGIAIGGREDDYTASNADFKRRGRRFDAQLDELKRLWAGEPRGYAGGVGPEPVQAGGPQLILGGGSEAAIRRTVEHGAGWIAAGGGADMFRQGAEAVKAAWSSAGREGAPRLMALSYFALGPNARANADNYLKHYYGFAGPFADMIAQGAAVGEEMVHAQVAAYREAGCDEVVFFPCSADPGQVDLLAAAIR